MLKKISNTLCNIIFPHICLSCKKNLHDEKQIICADCNDKLPVNRLPFCKKCGVGLTKDEVKKNFCRECLKNLKHLHFFSSKSVFLYKEPISDLICLFKYKEKIRLSNFFGQKMIEFIKNYALLNNIDIIVPIPLHKRRLREREFNQAEILAQIISKEYNLELKSKALTRVHMKNVQSKLDRSERFKNIQGAFKIEQDIFENKNILLIDDVFTTGATLSEAALVLKKARAKQVNAFTLARAKNTNTHKF